MKIITILLATPAQRQCQPPRIGRGKKQLLRQQYQEIKDAEKSDSDDSTDKPIAAARFSSNGNASNIRSTVYDIGYLAFGRLIVIW